MWIPPWNESTELTRGGALYNSFLWGGGGSCGVSAYKYAAVHMEPNKISIFNLYSSNCCFKTQNRFTGDVVPLKKFKPIARSSSIR
jgi:hypothetical protein